MRNKEDLLAIEDAKTLMQYLYLSPEHKVEFKNSIGVPLTLSMTDDFEILCQNGNFPDIPPTVFTSSMTLPATIGIVDILKEMPAIEFPESSKSRWEEIREICLANLALNFKGKKRRE